MEPEMEPEMKIMPGIVLEMKMVQDKVESTAKSNGLMI